MVGHEEGPADVTILDQTLAVGQFEPLGHGANKHGLAQAWCAFEQYMTISQERYQHLVEHFALTNQLGVQVAAQGEQAPPQILQFGFEVVEVSHRCLGWTF